MEMAMCERASTSAAPECPACARPPRHCHASRQQICDLPDNIIKEIFQNVEYRDVLQAKRVCQRLRKVLSRNAHLLSRPLISEMSVRLGTVERRTRPFGRLQLPADTSHSATRRRMNVAFVHHRNAVSGKSKELPSYKEYTDEEDLVGDRYSLSSQFLQSLCERFRDVSIVGTLSFHGIAIDVALYEKLTKSWVKLSGASNLVFTLCHFRIRSDLFCDLLKRTNCRKLNLELSQFGDAVLNDEVLESVVECTEFSASGTFPKYFARLTDRTLNRWATQEALPTRIFFQNVCGNFTLDGVLTLISAFQTKHADSCLTGNVEKTIYYEWNFGCVQMSQHGVGLMELMGMPGFVVHTTDHDYIPSTLDVTLTPKRPFFHASHNYRCWPIMKMQLAVTHNKTN